MCLSITRCLDRRRNAHRPVQCQVEVLRLLLVISDMLLTPFLHRVQASISGPVFVGAVRGRRAGSGSVKYGDLIRDHVALWSAQRVKFLNSFVDHKTPEKEMVSSHRGKC